MLQSISWQTYFTTCIVLFAAYYAIVAVVYYRQDILLKLNPQQVTFQQPVEIPRVKETDHRDYQPKATERVPANELYFSDAPEAATLSEQVMDEIHAFTAAASTGYGKYELLAALKKLLKKYSILKDLPIQSSINNTIVSECRNNCSIDLSEEEVVQLWNS